MDVQNKSEEVKEKLLFSRMMKSFSFQKWWYSASTYEGNMYQRLFHLNKYSLASETNF